MLISFDYYHDILVSFPCHAVEVLLESKLLHRSTVELLPSDLRLTVRKNNRYDTGRHPVEILLCLDLFVSAWNYSCILLALDLSFQRVQYQFNLRSLDNAAKSEISLRCVQF